MKDKQNVPHNHHYIPQFIIKNFGVNKMEIHTLNYYDVKRKKALIVRPEEIFAHNDLYWDDINNVEDPVKIEKDFAKYESEIANIVKNKIIKANDRI